MGIRLLEKQLTERLDYKKNKVTQLELTQDNPHRRHILDFVIKLASGANPPADPKHNDYLNLIKSMSLKYGSDGTQFTLSGVDKFFLDLFEYGTLPKRDSLVTPAANGTSEMHWITVFDFARARKVLSDFSALFNAPAKDSVFLEIEWGDITDIYNTPNDGTVDDSTELSVSLLEAFNDPRIEGESLETVLEKARDIIIGVEEKPITEAHDSYDDDMQEIKILPVPSLMLSHIYFTKLNTTDGDPSFSDDVIDQLKVQNVSSKGETIIQEYWDRMVAPTKTDYGLETLPEGMLYVDWRDQRQGGLQNLDVEALKLRLLTQAPPANKKNSIRILKKYIAL